MSIKPLRKAVFPVAGLGTRFLPATKVLPKEMLPLVDKPLIQNAVDEAREAGIEEFVFVTSDGKGMLEDHFDHRSALLQTLEQRGKWAELDLLSHVELPSGKLFATRQHVPLGLGHAVWCARHAIGNEPFAVILPDDVVLHQPGCLKQMVETYQRIGGNLVAVEEVPADQTDRYGILDIKGSDGPLIAVRGLVEKPRPKDAPSRWSIIGRYILQPGVFSHLDRQETGAGGEIQLTDAMARLIDEQPFHGFRFEGTRHDCGDKAGYIIANLAYALAREDMGARVLEAARALIEERT